MNLNEFMKKSLSLIDKKDIEREFNDVEMKYATTIASKDMEIADLDRKMNVLNKMIEEVNKNNSKLKNNLNSINEALKY